MLDRRDQLHARALAWQAVVVESLLTTEFILWEMMNGFSAPEDRLKAHAALDAIRASADWELVVSSADLLATGLTLHRKHHDKSWSLTDCISFHVMRERGITQALTHDHHFAQAGFEALLRRDPP